MMANTVDAPVTAQGSFQQPNGAINYLPFSS